MKAAILAGGGGTRLWPLSRQNYPKQFLKINSGNQAKECAFDKGSLIQQTAKRLLKAVSPKDIIIVTNNEYKFHTIADIEAISKPAAGNMILEPCRRNTAPAIALTLRYCLDKLKCSGDEVIFISPSDHIIEPVSKFVRCLKDAEKVARKGFIVTFGIKPGYPETGYGYIKAKGKKPVDSYYPVAEFAEKPDYKTAQKYLKHGGYYWNSGMFAFTIGTMEKELSKYAPDVFQIYQTGYDKILSEFSRMPNISIDYAVMEKSDRVVTMPMNLYWNDVGSWDSIFDVFPKDKSGNVEIGDITAKDTKNCLIMSEKRLVTTIGLENLLVIETDDAILVAKRGDAQKVKAIVEELKSRKRKEADEHTTIYRPWGSYTVLGDGERYRIKRVVIKPGHKLSLQLHKHRSEHWVVVKGTAKVTVGKKVSFVRENESTYIDKFIKHRLENPGKTPLELIEVQNGDRCVESDIVRFDDIYGRGCH
ncbi:MAG: mannose-1-phosphate guanylyltransferase/mannose-6-phosphate isomerase [Planctomycetota bacterium]